MERKKVIFPQNYKNKEGKEETKWTQGGYSFVNYNDNKVYTINLYLSMIPFEKNIRIFLQ